MGTYGAETEPVVQPATNQGLVKALRVAGFLLGEREQRKGGE
jgi:hypothetical protein